MTSTSDTSTNPKAVVPNRKKLDAHPATRVRLEKIQDPLERFIEASRIADQGYWQTEAMADLRQRRRVAVVALFRYHDYNKAEIARQIKAKDRRVVDFSFSLVDLRHIEEFRSRFRDEETGVIDEERALRGTLSEAKRVHSTYMRRESMGTTAREVRRILIWELTETEQHGRKYKPAHLAELAGRTTALIAQNRTGSSNRTKPASRAAARQQRKERETAAA